MGRSRKLVLTDWTKANDALNLYFEGNKSKLAEHVRMSRTTVTAFFKPEPVREAEFRKLCLSLRLNWQEVSAVQATPAESFANPPQPKSEVDPLHQVREHCRQKILSQHSRMRLLSGEEIGVDQLYVDVWLLNRSPRTYQVSENKLLETFDLRNDRLGLGDRIKRDPGFEVANANEKLLILGKPGAGKTTFLKHLAVDWCKGRFQPDLIAVFIELRRIQDREWQLLDAIGKELNLDEGHQIRALKQQIQQLQKSPPKSLEEEEEKEKKIKGFKQKLDTLPLQVLLKESKLLVLMDGLDEVLTNELRHNMQNQLREIVEEYSANRWILTCRTQIIASIPDGFTSVEVADFRPEQVKRFVLNWFRASGYSDIEIAQQWESFDNTVSRNSAVQELAVTPVLLSLMCLVFHDEGEMPSQLTELYKKGIRLLLEKWNDAKAIEGWEVGSKIYRQLSVEKKESLLIEIAGKKFDNPKNFILFQQYEIATQIAQFLQLANYNDGAAVLKAMEAQHGLLIERADELWSFSHLTFQEHFTVQWLTQLPLEQLAERVTNSRWQQVVEQLARSQQPVDHLLRLIKRSLDWSISSEPALNQFLTWISQKASSIEANNKLTALRAFYFALDQAFALNLNFDLAFDRTFALAIDLDRALTCILARALTRARDPNSDLNLDLDLARSIDLALALNCGRDRCCDLARGLDLTLAHALKIASSCNRELAIALKQLRTKLHSIRIMETYPDSKYFRQWWRAEGQQWLDHLQQAVIGHRNIGHDWKLTKSQRQQLQRYYDANGFLVKLMKIEGAVSHEVRAEIEDSLLLPWDELQSRYLETYR